MFTVLVIDDDAMILRGTARALKGLDWCVLVAGGPTQAVPLYGQADVVLSDWDMPDGGGLQVLREAPVPVVIYTGRPDAQPEGTRVLTKPTEVAEIDRALREAIAAEVL